MCQKARYWGLEMGHEHVVSCTHESSAVGGAEWVAKQADVDVATVIVRSVSLKWCIIC